jgi:hypothetical protein
MDGRKKKVSTWAPEWLSRRPDKVRVSEAGAVAGAAPDPIPPCRHQIHPFVAFNSLGGQQQQTINISLNTRVNCSYRC